MLNEKRSYNMFVNGLWCDFFSVIYYKNIRQMMGGRRDALMKSASNISNQSLRGSRIAIAIAIGIFMGCVFALFYPHGFFHPYPSSTSSTTRFSQSTMQVISVYTLQLFLFTFFYFDLFSGACPVFFQLENLNSGSRLTYD